MPLLHHVQQALRAHVHYQLDVQYMIKDGEVVIVDEFTGRLMPGRRWSDGLHQAVEAKEGVKIERENQTLATITFQNYFRKYKKLSGMTGTAETEAAEFAKIYNLDVIVDSDQPPDGAHRGTRPRLSHRRRKVGRDRRRHHQDHRAGPPGAGRHGVDRKVRARVEHAEAQGHEAHRAQREVSRAGSGNRRAGRPQGRRHHRHQHGRPRHRHPARRQSRVHGAPAEPQRRRRREGRQGRREIRRRRRVRQLLPRRRVLPRQARRLGSHLHALQAPDAKRSTRKSSTSAACTSSAPSATKRGASTTSCAAAPDARATRARRASSCRSKTT